MTDRSGIRIVGILGSVRPGNYTAMAFSLVEDEFRRKRPDVSLEVIDPGTLKLQFPGVHGDPRDAAKLREAVSKATGVILATPEYHGSFSAMMKLVIENLGFPSVLAGKPVTLLGVAAGEIGAIKSLEALAGVCHHIGAIVLPGTVSVSGVQKVFDDAGNCRDPVVERRIRSVATNLMDYIAGAICPRVALEAMVRGADK
jgi:chromate reductase, NAD(P)H dehydrogenase (quinone)